MFGFSSDISYKVVVLTICDHPSDFPDHVTMRGHCIEHGTPEPQAADIAGVYTSVEEARADVPPGAYCFPRSVFDDPVIVESWMV